MRFGSSNDASRRDEHLIAVVGVLVVVGLVMAYKLLPSDATPVRPLGAPLHGTATLEGKPVAGAEVMLSLITDDEHEIGEKFRHPEIDKTRTNARGGFTLHLPVSRQLVEAAESNGGTVNLRVEVFYPYREDGAPRMGIGVGIVSAKLNLGALPPWTFLENPLDIELMSAEPH